MVMVDLSRETRGPGGSPNLRGYVARPAGEGPWPGVVVVHEAFGANEVMRGHADRLAAAGYLTVMPDLFSDVGGIRCVAAMMRALSKGYGRAFQDIEAGRQWLLRQEDCTGRIGVTGFCIGGGFVIAVAPKYDAAAPNYGFLPKDVDAAVRGTCPTVASYGGADRQLKGAAATLETALTRAGVPHDVKEYPGAGHQFLNTGPTEPFLIRVVFRAMGNGPHPESAADAWQRIEAFFGKHLQS